MNIVGLLMLTVAVAACSKSDSAGPGESTSVGPPSTSITLSVTTTAAVTTTTIAPTTTGVPPPITTSPPTTTKAPTTLDIDGSPMIEFRIEVDSALSDRLTRADLVSFVIETLSDERSWSGRGVGFRLVDEGGLFNMTVASPERVDQLCAPLRTVGTYSCARNGWIAFNSDRWFGATETWPGDLATYRHYLVNHEVGHYVRGPSHDQCPGEGLPAPVMMQQTKGLKGCLPNGWVDP